MFLNSTSQNSSLNTDNNDSDINDDSTKAFSALLITVVTVRKKELYRPT